jgi:hypothetical protein
MFLGHFALAFGAKRAAPAVSLGALILACQLADLLWPVLVLLGTERVEVRPGATAVTPLDFVHYPYSHSLVALAVWGAVAGLVYAAATRSTAFAGVLVGTLVLSHWVLDAIAHRPDMPLTVSGNTRVGLGLWNSVGATLAVELMLFLVGLGLYLRGTVARDRVGSIGLWSLVALLLLVYGGAVFGPPPPDVTAVVVPAFAMWLIVLAGYWIDAHRRAAFVP